MVTACLQTLLTVLLSLGLIHFERPVELEAKAQVIESQEAAETILRKLFGFSAVPCRPRYNQTLPADCSYTPPGRPGLRLTGADTTAEGAAICERCVAPHPPPRDASHTPPPPTRPPARSPRRRAEASPGTPPAHARARTPRLYPGSAAPPLDAGPPASLLVFDAALSVLAAWEGGRLVGDSGPLRWATVLDAYKDQGPSSRLDGGKEPTELSRYGVATPDGDGGVELQDAHCADGY